MNDKTEVTPEMVADLKDGIAEDVRGKMRKDAIESHPNALLKRIRILEKNVDLLVELANAQSDAIIRLNKVADKIQ